MRTNIVLDDDLVTEAIRIAGTKTKRATIERALRHFVEDARQRKAMHRLQALRGREDLLDPDYDVIQTRWNATREFDRFFRLDRMDSRDR